MEHPVYVAIFRPLTFPTHVEDPGMNPCRFYSYSSYSSTGAGQPARISYLFVVLPLYFTNHTSLVQVRHAHINQLWRVFNSSLIVIMISLFTTSSVHVMLRIVHSVYIDHSVRILTAHSLFVHYTFSLQTCQHNELTSYSPVQLAFPSSILHGAPALHANHES
jgi:hypothetical protein